MENIFFVIFIFGVPGLIGFSFTPMGRAIANRIRYGVEPRPITDPVIYDELEQLRAQVGELQERVDFAERMLARPAGVPNEAQRLT